MALALLGGDNEAVLRQVLPAKPHGIGAAQAGVKQYLEGKPQRRTNMTLAECGDVPLRPRSVARGLKLHALGDNNRVIAAHPGRHRVIHDGLQTLPEIARGRRPVGHLVDEVVDVPGLNASNRPLAVLVDETIQDVAINGLRALGQRLEFGAPVVAPHSSSNRAGLDTPHLRRWLVGAHSSAIGRPEFRGVKRRRQGNLRPARPTQIDARLPVPVQILVYVFGFPLPHCLSQ
ncbi:hypothetical protein [Bradyrhizobium sp. LB14.3]|uniref:hypothetical protein n=1 Tax=Bradyrhizobium sp. LB14.3 TaxID=3156328 RepID=UPI0033937452